MGDLSVGEIEHDCKDNDYPLLPFSSKFDNRNERTGFII
jgi:hypothetical protein